MADHFDRARTGLGLADRLTCQHGTSGAFGINGVAFALLMAQLPVGSVHLDDGVAPLAQEPGRAGTIRPGALDAERLDRSHRLGPEFKRGVALAAGRDGCRSQVDAVALMATAAWTSLCVSTPTKRATGVVLVTVNISRPVARA